VWTSANQADVHNDHLLSRATEFDGVLEQVIRDGLQKAVENVEVYDRLNRPDYWEGLL
jgi:hypothetical protein